MPISGFVQELKAQWALASLRGMLQRKARVLRDGASMYLAAQEVLPGDIIGLEEGGSILLDVSHIRPIEVDKSAGLLVIDSNPYREISDERKV